MVMKTAKSVFSALGLTLGHPWEAELPKFSWTTINFTSLELENSDEDLKSLILHSLYYGPSGLKDVSSSSLMKTRP